MSFFLVVEGLDGAGKGLQRQMLLERLRNEGQTVWDTIEPTDGPKGKQIRRILNKEISMPSDPTEFQMLYVEDREGHAVEIQQHLDAGETVLCDRYDVSTLAYGKVAGADVERLRVANAKFPRPDVVIWLNLDPAVARQRMVKRGKLDEHDANFEFQTKLRAAYSDLLLEYPGMVEVDASGTPEEVHERIWEAISTRLSLAPVAA